MNSIKQIIQPHLRIIIRKRVKELLRLHCDINERVYCSRPDDSWLEEIPNCLVYFTSDNAREPDERPRRYNRTLVLNIHFLNRWEKKNQLEMVDDWFDSRELEVLYAMEVDHSLNSVWLGLDFLQNCYLVRSEPITLDGKGNKDVQSNRITYNVVYDECLNFLIRGDIAEFKELYIKYLSIDPNPGDPSGDKKLLAEDHITIID